MNIAGKSRNRIVSIRHYPEYKTGFFEYPKIRPLRRNVDVLGGGVEVTEKIHGINLRLLVLPDGLAVGSRHRSLSRDEVPRGHPLDEPLEIIAADAALFAARQELPPGTLLFGEAFGGRHSGRAGYEGAPVSIRFFNYLTPKREWRYVADLLEVLPQEYVVPLIGHFPCLDETEARQFLVGSELGTGDKEGVVLKRVDENNKYGLESWAKIVNEEFTEDKRNHRVHLSPKQTRSVDLAAALVDELVTPTRMEKAVARVDEDGKLARAPHDLPLLLKALKRDLNDETSDRLEECKIAGMKEKAFWKAAKKCLDAWYRAQLG